MLELLKLLQKVKEFQKSGEPDPTPMIALDVANFLWTNVCRHGSRTAVNGNGIIIQIQGPRRTFKMGNANCNFWCFSSYCWSGAGEAFGYHLDHMGPFEGLLEKGGALHSVSWIVGILSVAELTLSK